MTELRTLNRADLAPIEAAVTRDQPLAVKPSATTDFQSALKIVKSSTERFDRATRGRGEFVSDTWFAKFAKRARAMLPYEVDQQVISCGFIGAVAGVAGAIGTSYVMPGLEGEVGWGLGALVTATPLGVAATNAIASLQRKVAADKLMPANAPKHLEHIAESGEPFAKAVAAREAQSWMNKASSRKALSPEARFKLEDLVERAQSLPGDVTQRAACFTQLAEIVADGRPITTGVVGTIGHIVAQLEPDERREVIRAISAEVADRKAPAITYEARHALADLGRSAQVAS